ncbi:hypothetical protein SBA2_300001 [Acidobacteriia bacterium SbA2]|nr:hypothetical protein SBA2_300001 [Acidobacteriia bacterium SbA2]
MAPRLAETSVGWSLAMPWRAPLKLGSPLRGRSDFSIDRLDSAPRQELSLREIADFSVRSLRQPAPSL